MTAELIHRNYKIEADSYLDENTKKWVPRATVISLDRNKPEQRPLAWQREFDGQTEADSFALQGAQFYIDNKL